MVTIAPADALFEKTASNVQETIARGGQVLLFSDQAGIDKLAEKCRWSVTMPKAHSFITPILYVIPAQLAGVLRRRLQGNRCGSAAQSGEICDGGIGAILQKHHVWITLRHVLAFRARASLPLYTDLGKDLDLKIQGI